MENNNILYFITYEYRTKGFLMFSDVIFEENYTDAQRNYASINKKLKDYFNKIKGAKKLTDEYNDLNNLVKFSDYLNNVFGNSLKDNKQNKDNILLELNNLLDSKGVTHYAHITSTDNIDYYEPYSKYSEKNYIYNIPKYVKIVLFRILEAKTLNNYIYDYMKKTFRSIQIETLQYSKNVELRVYKDSIRKTIYFAKNLEDIKIIIKELATNGFNANYFRGHSQINFPLVPGIYRSKIMDHENELSEAIINHHYREFNRLRFFPDYLSLLQHYGTPTRLLDITSDYKVAAYFASLGNNKFGEIFLFQFSDDNVVISNDRTANILSSVTLMDKKSKLSIEDRNKFSTLNKAFVKRGYLKLPDDIRFEEFQDYKIILDSFSNNRVFGQKGSFILFGINFPKISIQDQVTKRIIIVDKFKILEELENRNINQLYLFPELDKTCEYFKAKYSK